MQGWPLVWLSIMPGHNYCGHSGIWGQPLEGGSSSGEMPVPTKAPTESDRTGGHLVGQAEGTCWDWRGEEPTLEELQY